MRPNPTSAPNPSAAAMAAMRSRPGGSRKPNATSENPSAACPETNEQLARIGCGQRRRGELCDPPNPRSDRAGAAPMVLQHGVGQEPRPQRIPRPENNSALRSSRHNALPGRHSQAGPRRRSPRLRAPDDPRNRPSRARRAAESPDGTRVADVKQPLAARSVSAASRTKQSPRRRARHRLRRPFTPSVLAVMRLRTPAQHSRAGARGIVRDRIGPVLDTAGERAGDAGIAHRPVKAGEFGVAAVEAEDVDGFAGRRRLADHRHRIGGHQNRVGERQIGEIRVLRRLPSQIAADNPAEPLLQQRQPVRPGAPRRRVTSAEPPRSRSTAAATDRRFRRAAPAVSR